MKKLMMLMALSALTACDYSQRADARAERDDRLYRTAMDDYRSGRMDAAIAGFGEAVRQDPANASARFQLACLLQDVRRDFIGAYCSYREFLMLRPDADKAKLAKDRMALCEKTMAKELSERHGLSGSEALSAELESVRKRLKAAQDRAAACEKNLGESVARLRTLSEERDRLLDVVKGISDSDAADRVGKRPTAVEAKALLEEEEDDDTSRPPANEGLALKDEEAEDLSTGSSLLPKSEPATAAAPARQLASDSQAPDRPKTYVVKEGDTLYGIAKRFYGTRTMWRAIRNANKAQISMDNRLRVGTTIVLP